MKNNQVIYNFLKSKGFKLKYMYDFPCTFAWLKHDGSPYFISGQAICSDMDQFVKQKGREHALRRALIAAMHEGLLTPADVAYCMSDKAPLPEEKE